MEANRAWRRLSASEGQDAGGHQWPWMSVSAVHWETEKGHSLGGFHSGPVPATGLEQREWVLTCPYLECSDLTWSKWPNGTCIVPPGRESADSHLTPWSCRMREEAPGLSAPEARGKRVT